MGIGVPCPVWSGDGTVEWIWAVKGRAVPDFGWVLLQEAHSGQGIPWGIHPGVLIKIHSGYGGEGPLSSLGW